MGRLVGGWVGGFCAVGWGWVLLGALGCERG